MASDDEIGESPVEILKGRQRKEKKELQAKVATLKKAAKSGNKKQQKDAAEESVKMEKELDERHARELKECQELGASSIPAEPKTDTVVNEKKEEEVEEKAFYKENKVKNKNQKKQDKKTEEARRRAEAAAADEEAAKTSMRTTEMEAVNKTLSSRGLRLVDIAPDGDCLFNAVAHQMASQSCGSDMRKRAAAFIRAHKDDFLPFLSKEDGEMLDEFEFEEYCIKIEKPASTGGVWGGEPELRALSESLERKIEVVQPDTRVLVFGDRFSGRPLILTYHRHAYSLGEHYNSTATVTAA